MTLNHRSFTWFVIKILSVIPHCNLLTAFEYCWIQPVSSDFSVTFFMPSSMLMHWPMSNCIQHLLNRAYCATHTHCSVNNLYLDQNWHFLRKWAKYLKVSPLCKYLRAAREISFVLMRYPLEMKSLFISDFFTHASCVLNAWFLPRTQNFKP